MKKRHLIVLAALALAAVLLLLPLIGGHLCIGHLEQRSADQWSHMHMYLYDDYTAEFPVTAPNQPIVFQWETGRGSFSARITDAGGAVLYSTSSDTSGSAAFLASSDLTLQIDARGHGGIFALTRRDGLSLSAAGQEPEPFLLVDGTHCGDAFTRDFRCWKYDGSHLNFYVENRGSDSVRLTINGTYDRVIPAGGSGHISAPISATVAAQDMTVKCSSTGSEDLNIYWKVAQR